ncbi:MAG TPA: addiction module protein [Thiobacillaceae bacterium]|nr:addiction module protein [Thiobacillaceae bacterium]
MTRLELDKLPLQDKLRLMESLWDAICHDATGEPEVPDWHVPLLEARLARLDAGDETMSDWEEAKDRLRAQAKPR